ncbi:MAG TPA: alkaline phosphatase family protein [Bryobacteraceae bacterium]|nr:alkaline phosphatase family protein [Bryobacteraceae bacterium]
MGYTQGSRVLMLGIDAGDVNIIRSSLDTLPRLRQLFADGPVSKLQSSAALTSSVWPTFSTGTPPGQHGSYYPMQWDPAAMTLRRVAADWIDYEPFWYALARQGKHITTLDVPFSLPSRLERGVEVQNWGSQECLGPFGSNRPELAREIRKRFGEHPMGSDVPIEEPAHKLELLRNNLVAGARRKGELARWLMETTRWDLFITVFAECHRGGHTLQPGSRPAAVPPNALSEVYQAVDRAIGHILDGVDRETTTIVVFSVHGMRANLTQEHFVLPLMERINATFETGGMGSAATAPEVKSNPMRILRAAIPPRLQYGIAKAVPAGARDWVVRRAYCGGLDWKKTLGFALPGSGEGYLRYNMAGREMQGSLQRGSERHQRYEKWLTDSLLSFKDARTHAPIVKEVVFAHDAYPGPRSGYLPDAIILWNDLMPAQEIYSDRLGRLSASLTTGRTGEHQPEGFAVVAGDRRGLEEAPRLEHASDFAGLVRHLLHRTGSTRTSATSV